MKFPRTEYDMGTACYQGAQPYVNCVIVHETQGTTVAGGVNTLKTRPDGSAHEIGGWDGDKMRVVRLATDRAILCHTGGQNTGTLGYEKVGISSWSKAFRLANKKERHNISLAAFRTARMLKRNSIPPRYLSVKDLKRYPSAGFAKGWTYHRNCAKAFGTTSHTDPGVPNVSWPHNRFNRLVRYYYNHPAVRETVTMRTVRKWEKDRSTHP